MVHQLQLNLYLLLVGSFLASLVGAVLLQVSCRLFNLLAGAPREPKPPPVVQDEGAEQETGPGVPTPSIEKAACIVFFTVLLDGVLTFILLRVLRLAGLGLASALPGAVSIPFFSYPLGFLLLGGINAAMLPTTVRKGFLIALFVLLFSLIVAAFLAVVLFVIAVIFGPGVFQFG